MTALQPSTDLEAPSAVRRTNAALLESLPTPPSDASVDRYLHRRGRWVRLACMVAYLPALASITIFSLRSPWLTPLIAVAAMNVVSLCLAALTGLRRSRITPESHHLQRAQWWEDRLLDGQFPTIDIFLPTCGEPISVLRNTYRHVSRLQWGPGLRVWVLDDLGSSRVAEAAAAFGFEYLVRPNRGEMKKAGNLKFAFEHTSADLVAVFDADFCPREDYLLHLVPYFEEPQVGIVQSPQYFATTPSMGWLERGAGSTQELFYRWIQPSRDTFGAAICVGTCAIYRRTALEAVGGFAQIEHSEDVHTGVAVLSSGRELRYVPAVLAQGLCPDQLSSFLNQQYRWCTGSLSLLASGLKRRHRLPLRQRLCYWSGFMYYLSTALNVVALPIPVIVMLTRYADDVHPAHLVPLLPALLVQLVVMPRMMTCRWRPDVNRVQLAYSFAHLVAVVHTLRRRSAAWMPTGAPNSSGTVASTVARVAVILLSTYLLTAWTALVHDVHRYGFENFTVVTVFLTLYSYYTVPLILDFLPIVLGSRKHAQRRAVVRTEERLHEGRLPWSDVVARTILVTALALYATGAVDPSPLFLR